MEFARDTEIQTPEFRTTQENIAAYVCRTWNTPEMFQDWESLFVFWGLAKIQNEMTSFSVSGTTD